MDDQTPQQPTPDPDAQSSLPAGAVELALTDAAQCASAVSAELGTGAPDPEKSSQPVETVAIEQRSGKVDAQLDAIDEMLSSIVQDVGESTDDPPQKTNADMTPETEQSPQTPPDAAETGDPKTVAPDPKPPAPGNVITLPPPKTVSLPAKKPTKGDEPETPSAEAAVIGKPAAIPLPPVQPKQSGVKRSDNADLLANAASDAKQPSAAATAISREEWNQFDDAELPSLDDGTGQPASKIVALPDAQPSGLHEPAPDLSEPPSRPPLLIRRALEGVADTLDVIDRPFVRLGDRIRRVLGWAAIMMLFAAVCIILTLQFV